MWGLVTRLLVVCGPSASIMGLLLQIGPLLAQWRWWDITLMAFGTVLLLAFVVTEFSRRNRYRVYRRSNLKAIRRYMQKWIEPGDRVAIWTTLRPLGVLVYSESISAGSLLGGRNCE